MSYYVNRAKSTNNNVLKARYCDVLVEEWHIRDPEIVKIGIDAYLNNADFFSINNDLNNTIISLMRAFILSKIINNKSFLEESLNKSLKFIEDNKSNPNILHFNKLIKKFQENKEEYKNCSKEQ